MVENFHVRANKVVGTHAGAKIVGLKFFSAKKCLRTAFVARDKAQNSGTVPAIPGRLATMHYGRETEVYKTLQREQNGGLERTRSR